MGIEFRPLAGNPGTRFVAEVLGVAPNLRIGEPEFGAIEAAWYRHSILLFRGLETTPDDHIAQPDEGGAGAAREVAAGGGAAAAGQIAGERDRPPQKAIAASGLDRNQPALLAAE
jgi:hypothetical protein